ncbi:hypothetical protein [Asanoa siamensis]|uniref:Uncharacterized protein n=1 Tax=Asanoa siamensis TaxID=926357 RepID=A0ABQ4CR94_9ACTN|nr:hypothetical protein [Asanoa siamensis]GIF73791.1 hypothetical protein Asi02nite_33090 [Asanoa siamensis]
MSTIDELRAELRPLEGPVRARPLVELAQELSNAYWRAGPGKPAALPFLNDAITAADEAYTYFQDGDEVRRRVSALRGQLYGTRHLAHLSPTRDRDIAVAQIREALASRHLPPAVWENCQLTLGQLYLRNLVSLLQGPDLTARILHDGLPPSATVDVDRAVECFEAVRRAPLTREAKDAAELLLRMADALRTIVTIRGGGSGTAAMNQLVAAMAAIQEFHTERSTVLTAGPMINLTAFDADEVADRDPLDRPVAVVEADDPAGEPTPRQVRAPAAAPSDPDEAGALRRELRARVSGGADLFDALDDLLDPTRPAPAPSLVDDVVALATAVVDAGAANRTDRLLLAVGLCLRARAAGARWIRRDLDDATAALLEAASADRPPPPDAMRVMRRLSTLLDALDPRCRAEARLSERLQPSRSGRRHSFPRT